MVRFILLFVFCFVFAQSDVYSQEEVNSEGALVCCFPILIFASFNGDLGEFIERNLCYPNKHEQGKVFVSFEIDTNGYIVNPKVMKGMSEEHNNEALRIFKIMPQWEPARDEEGKPIHSKKALPIIFR